METLLDTFSQIFEKELLQEIEKVSTLKSFQENDVIIDFGANIKWTPILLSGLIKILRVNENGDEVLLYYVKANESCAMTFTCCMQHKQSEIKAVVEEEVELLIIPVQYMDEWMSKYPSWKSYIMGTIDTKFNELLHAFDQVAFQKLDQRLLNYLIEKSEASHSTLINLSHEGIAKDLGSSRVVISRLLKQLENNGDLLLYRGQIKLLKQIFEQV